MSSLIYQAKELHYDSATMLMKLKAEMQVSWNYEDYFDVMIGLVQGVVTSLFESWTLSAFLHYIDYSSFRPK
jgi:hypothetical protein